jgi:hypothetical protein
MQTMYTTQQYWTAADVFAVPEDNPLGASTAVVASVSQLGSQEGNEQQNTHAATPNGMQTMCTPLNSTG